MSYSVNFSQTNDNDIVLGNVVIAGNVHTPTPNMVVFKKNFDGTLTKQHIDLAKINYSPVPVASVVPTVPLRTVDPKLLDGLSKHGIGKSLTGGSSSTKTKRNRRKNNRFIKKSYKRRN